MARLRQPTCLCWSLLILLAALTVLATGSPLPSADRAADLSAGGPAASTPITALVPVEILLENLREGAGIAVGPDGAILAADRKGGVIYRLDPEGTVTMPFAGLVQLRAPVGLWLEEDGSLLVSDEERGEVWRLNGGASLVAWAFEKPRWLVRAGDAAGTIYLTADGLSAGGGATSASRREGNALIRIPGSGKVPEVLVAGLRSPQGVAPPRPLLPVAVEGYQSGGENQGPAVLGVRLDPPPGGQEPPEVLLGAGVLQPGGLAWDALGALWLAAGQWRDPSGPSSPPVHGVVARVLPGGGVSILVRGLVSPKGLAFGPGGHLHLAEEGRLLRLRAPDPPQLSPEPPGYTNQAALHLSGSALPGAVITARADSGAATTQTDPQTGLFSFSELLSLTANRENTIEVFATSLAGAGLTSGPSTFHVFHDDVAPAVSARTDPGGEHLRGQVRLIAEAHDPAPEAGAASGLARLTLRLLDAGSNEVARAGAEALGTTDPLMASLPLDSSSLPDGPYSLEATAEDSAGNRALASQPRILDNTPPTLGILGVSNGAMVRGTLQVEVVSADVSSGLDLLELFLDGQLASSNREAPLRAALDTRLLGSGVHTLLARAADRAGNEATAAVHFTVANLSIHLVSPTSGSTVPSGPVLVQGTVESPAPEVGVIVNDVVAHVHGGTFAALVSLEAGSGILTILATDSAGATANASATVMVTSALPPPDLVIVPETGLAPLSVEFTSASASPGGGATFTLDFADGSSTHGAASLEGVPHTYVAPGLYFPTLTVTDPTGQVATVTGIVEAHAATTLDALLRSKWDGFRAALSRGDIEAALANVATSAQEKYRRVFQDLGPTLPTVAGQLQDIHLLEVLPGYAGYATYRQQQGETFLYFIEFVQDADGLWRLENM